jgi:hypothetical protein
MVYNRIFAETNLLPNLSCWKALKNLVMFIKFGMHFDVLQIFDLPLKIW